MSRLRTSRTSGSTGDRQSGQSESRDRFGLPTTKRSNETSSHRRRNPYLPGGIQWPPPARHTPAPPRAEPAPPGGASAPGAPSRASPQGGSWVWGSLLAQVAAVLHTLGMVGVRAVLRRGKEAARWRPLLRLSFWKAVLLRTLACQVWWAARCCAPDTTVAPVFLGFTFLTNMAAGPALLREQYHSREVLVALVCVVLVVVILEFDLSVVGEGAPRWESETIRTPAVIWCAALWCFVFLACLLLFCCRSSSSVKRGLQPLPILSGLVSGAMYFVGYVGFPNCSAWHPLLQFGNFWTVALICCGMLCLYFSVEGCRRYDCRFFVPLSSTVAFSTATVLRMILAGNWKTLDRPGLFLPFLAAHLSLLLLVSLCICAEPAAIGLPQALKEPAGPDIRPPHPPTARLNPREHGTVDKLPLAATPLLELVNEHSEGAMLDPEQEYPKLRVRLPKGEGRSAFELWAKLGSALPMFAVAIVPVCFLFNLVCGVGPQHTLKALGYFTAVVVCGGGLRTVVFASVARHRVKMCMAMDYEQLLRSGRQRKVARRKGTKVTGGGGCAVLVGDPWGRDSSSSSDEDVEHWGEAIRHFVVVEGLSDPSSRQLRHKARTLLSSIASSPMAASQVEVFFVAMDMASSHDRAVSDFSRLFDRRIWKVRPEYLATNADAPAAVGQESVRSRVIRRLLEAARREGLRSRLVLVTYTTVDTIFDRNYFSALTFAFLASGSKRSRTIWQPPVLFLADYHEQSTVARHVSLFFSQSQLASLADPLAVPLPGSTCSLPLSLLQAVDDCWEPEQSARLHSAGQFSMQNSGIWSKCWLSTIGRSSVQPIFLPALRCRGSLDVMQLHAEGLFELVYFFSALPLAIFTGRSKPSNVRVGRLICLALRSLLPMVGIAWSHIQMSTWLVAMLFTGFKLLYGLFFWPAEEKNTLAFLLGATVFAWGIGLLPLFALCHAALLSEQEVLRARAQFGPAHPPEAGCLAAAPLACLDAAPLCLWGPLLRLQGPLLRALCFCAGGLGAIPFFLPLAAMSELQAACTLFRPPEADGPRPRAGSGGPLQPARAARHA